MAVDLKYGQIEIMGIPEGEPVFVFRAQDLLADEVLDTYADKLEGQFSDRDEIIALVRQQAQNFRDWPTRKYPD